MSKLLISVSTVSDKKESKVKTIINKKLSENNTVNVSVKRSSNKK